jgi:hypothetical protein
LPTRSPSARNDPRHDGGHVGCRRSAVTARQAAGRAAVASAGLLVVGPTPAWLAGGGPPSRDAAGHGVDRGPADHDFGRGRVALVVAGEAAVGGEPGQRAPCSWWVTTSSAGASRSTAPIRHRSAGPETLARCATSPPTPWNGSPSAQVMAPGCHGLPGAVRHRSTSRCGGRAGKRKPAHYHGKPTRTSPQPTRSPVPMSELFSLQDDFSARFVAEPDTTALHMRVD